VAQRTWWRSSRRWRLASPSLARKGLARAICPVETVGVSTDFISVGTLFFLCFAHVLFNIQHAAISCRNVEFFIFFSSRYYLDEHASFRPRDGGKCISQTLSSLSSSVDGIYGICFIRCNVS
jgi:hypothetical protein